MRFSYSKYKKQSNVLHAKSVTCDLPIASFSCLKKRREKEKRQLGLRIDHMETNILLDIFSNL